jgi:hypothetical protein
MLEARFRMPGLGVFENALALIFIFGHVWGEGNGLVVFSVQSGKLGAMKKLEISSDSRTAASVILGRLRRSLGRG